MICDMKNGDRRKQEKEADKTSRTERDKRKEKRTRDTRQDATSVMIIRRLAGKEGSEERNNRLIANLELIRTFPVPGAPGRSI